MWANEGGNVGQQSTHTAYLEKRVAYVLDLIERERDHQCYKPDVHGYTDKLERKN